MARTDLRRFVGVALGGARGKSTALARIERLDAGDGRARLVVAEARQRPGERGAGQPLVAGTGPDAVMREPGDAAREPAGAADPADRFRDDLLLHTLQAWIDDHTVVAIDAPLTLPPCLRCDLACPGVPRCEVPVVVWMRAHAPALAPRHVRRGRAKPRVTPYIQRATTVLLEAVEGRGADALGAQLGPLAARAHQLRRQLSPWLRLHENLLEVHPQLTIARRLGHELERRTRHGDAESVWAARRAVLDALTTGLTFEHVWPELVVRRAPVFDAVVAAVTAELWAREGWQGPAELAVGSHADAPVRAAVAALELLWLDDGWIWVPPPSDR